MKRVTQSAGDAYGNDHDTFGLGAKGFIVQIAGSDSESFPDEPVDVRFKMRQPASIPEPTGTVPISRRRACRRHYSLNPLASRRRSTRLPAPVFWKTL
jgi:hypothetical protein